jgi:hypothetical protein
MQSEKVMVIDIGGAGDYVPKLDARIKRIKNIFRSVKADLPLQLPPLLVKDLVAAAVSNINIQWAAATSQNVCAQVLFTGMKLDFRNELPLVFGGFFEVYDGTDNTARSRTDHAWCYIHAVMQMDHGCSLTC